MYKCNECGCVFDEVATWQEDRGEFWGQKAYETMWGCPHCYSGDFEEISDDVDKDDEDDEDGDDS